MAQKKIIGHKHNHCIDFFHAKQKKFVILQDSVILLQPKKSVPYKMMLKV